MKRILLISLCLVMIACAPTAKQAEEPLTSMPMPESSATPEQAAPEATAAPEAGQTPTAVTITAPSEAVGPTAASTPDGEKEAALLYRGERVNLYRGRSDDSWGIIMEEFTWPGHNYIYQRLPGTSGIVCLDVMEIRTEADEYLSEASFYIRYLDSNGKERIFCLHHPASDYPDFYPVTDETSLTLSEQEQHGFEEMMVIGVLYEVGPTVFAEEDLDDWELLCQRTILDALYTLHDNALPSYLPGETKEKYCIIMQTALDGFFRSTVGRPNLVPDLAYPAYRDEMVFVEEDWSKLQPGQVPVADNDWTVWAEVQQAVLAEDGSITLYGYVGINDSYWKAAQVRVAPADGYLGWRIEQTEACGRTDFQFDASITFAPAQ